VVDSMLLSMDGPRGTGPLHSLFDVRQRHDDDGAVRMTLVGELDLSTTERFKARFDELQRSKRPIRLDLSDLEFVDCSGIRAILDAMTDARREGHALDVDRSVSPIVGRIVSLSAIAGELWPAETDVPGSAAAT
jgi:anti-anti-sigma factor